MSESDLKVKAEEQIKLHEKQKELHDMRIQMARHKQAMVFQEKLNARLKKREETKKAKEKEKESVEESTEVKPPSGDVTFVYVTIKNIASILELTDEETALKTLEDIHDLIVRDLESCKIYKVKEDVGKFLLASQDAIDMIKYAMRIQVTFNEKEWPDLVLQLPTSRRLFRPEDIAKQNATPLFSGPRVSIGIHRGEAASGVSVSGQSKLSDIDIIKTEIIGNFAQGGQILISSVAWEKLDVAKLPAYNVNHLGVFKLEGFGGGCKLFEILPNILKDRSKFFGSVCARCNEVIMPKEKFFKALDCVWHMDHFQCFQCNTKLEGTYMDHEGFPHCRNCFLIKNAPKCKSCNESITGGYINALDGYWHSDCFCCKKCSKLPSSEVKVYEYKGFPYCADCYEEVHEDKM